MYNELKAASLIAAKKDIRYYLNGVRFTRTNDTLKLSATDGHMLCVIDLDLYAEGHDIYRTLPADLDVVVPIEAINQVLKLHKKNDVIPFDAGEKMGRIGVIEFEAVDGRFPVVERVIDSNAGSNDKHDATTGIGLGFAKLEQLGKAGKSFNPDEKFGGACVKVKGATDTVRFETKNHKGSEMLVLLSPMRL